VLPVCSVLVGGRASTGGDPVPAGSVVEVLPPFAGG
jgi:molybdopterin synthase sulfur carrier subunit